MTPNPPGDRRLHQTRGRTNGGQDYTRDLGSGNATWGGYHIPKDHPDQLRALVEKAAELKVEPEANQAE